jgi:hypothetical protein
LVASPHHGRVPRPRLLRSRLTVLMKPLLLHLRPPRIMAAYRVRDCCAAAWRF